MSCGQNMFHRDSVMASSCKLVLLMYLSNVFPGDSTCIGRTSSWSYGRENILKDMVEDIAMECRLGNKWILIIQ